MPERIVRTVKPLIRSSNMHSTLLVTQSVFRAVMPNTIVIFLAYVCPERCSTSIEENEGFCAPH